LRELGYWPRSFNDPRTLKELFIDFDHIVVALFGTEMRGQDIFAVHSFLPGDLRLGRNFLTMFRVSEEREGRGRLIFDPTKINDIEEERNSTQDQSVSESEEDDYPLPEDLSPLNGIALRRNVTT
jgi:hypothetical protein